MLTLPGQSRRQLDTTRPGIRQLASTVGIAIALLTAGLVPGVELRPVSVSIAAALVALATVAGFVLPWQRWSERWVLVLPLVSLLAFGIFRLGSGGSQSVYAALLILPVVWIATERGRAMIVLCALGTGAMMALPFLVGLESWSDAQLVRVFFAPLVFAMMAAVVNELSHRSRQQIAAAGAVADERAVLLTASEASEARLAVVAEALREAEAFHRSVWLAITHQAVVITDVEGRVVEWGPGAERLLGVPRADAIGVRAADFLRPSQSERAGTLGFDALLRLADEGEVADGLQLRTAGGALVPVDVTYSPRLDREGRLEGYILVAHDTTQAHEAARLKDEFVGTVSHELRTPLSSVLGYLELLRDDEAGLSDEQLQYLGVAERNAHRLLTLVGDLLFVAQVDAGRFPMELSRVDLVAVVLASMESAMPHAAQQGIEIVAPPIACTAVVRGDASRLGQALDNLISNAVKFTPRGGTVTVTLRREGDQTVLCVADTGMGIPDDEMERLFTRFFRSSTASRQAVKGVGLGLNITRAIVDAHGGRLSAVSVEGEGTTFEIWLPTLPSDE